MPSKQFDHLQESTLRRLRDLIPPDCPLLVQRLPAGGFRVMTLDERDRLSGRYQVVAAWVAGYVCSWRRVRPITPEQAIEQLRVVRQALDAGVPWQGAEAERSDAEQPRRAGPDAPPDPPARRG
jgi:hypothetical protein